MKDFFKITKFKIILTIIILGLTVLLDVFFGLRFDTVNEIGGQLIWMLNPLTVWLYILFGKFMFISLVSYILNIIWVYIVVCLIDKYRYLS